MGLPNKAFSGPLLLFVVIRVHFSSLDLFLSLPEFPSVKLVTRSCLCRLSSSPCSKLLKSMPFLGWGAGGGEGASRVANKKRGRQINRNPTKAHTTSLRVIQFEEHGKCKREFSESLCTGPLHARDLVEFCRLVCHATLGTELTWRGLAGKNIGKASESSGKSARKDKLATKRHHASTTILAMVYFFFTKFSLKFCLTL